MLNYKALQGGLWSVWFPPSNDSHHLRAQNRQTRQTTHDRRSADRQSEDGRAAGQVRSGGCTRLFRPAAHGAVTACSCGGRSRSGPLLCRLVRTGHRPVAPPCTVTRSSEKRGWEKREREREERVVPQEAHNSEPVPRARKRSTGGS